MQAGRLFLAGDAAHIVTTAGGRHEPRPPGRGRTCRRPARPLPVGWFRPPRRLQPDPAARDLASSWVLARDVPGRCSPACWPPLRLGIAKPAIFGQDVSRQPSTRARSCHAR